MANRFPFKPPQSFIPNMGSSPADTSNGNYSAKS